MCEALFGFLYFVTILTLILLDFKVREGLGLGLAG